MMPDDLEAENSNLQFGESTLGLYFATTGVCARLSALAKITGASGTAKQLQNISQFFGSCVIWGYDQTISRFIWKKSKDLQWYQSLPRLSNPTLPGTGSGALTTMFLGTTMLQGLVSGAEDTLLNTDFHKG